MICYTEPNSRYNNSKGEFSPDDSPCCASETSVRSNRRPDTSSLMTETTALNVCEGMVVALAKSLCIDEDTREDLEQEGRIAVLRAHAAYRKEEGASFGTVVYKYIRSAMLEAVRKWEDPPADRERGPKTEEKTVVFSYGVNPAHFDSADESPVEPASERTVWLQDMMSRLPEDERAAIKAVQLDGLTLREAADELNTNHMAVKRRMERGLARMREWATE